MSRKKKHDFIKVYRKPERLCVSSWNNKTFTGMQWVGMVSWTPCLKGIMSAQDTTRPHSWHKGDLLPQSGKAQRRRNKERQEIKGEGEGVGWEQERRKGYLLWMNKELSLDRQVINMDCRYIEWQFIKVKGIPCVRMRSLILTGQVN